MEISKEPATCSPVSSEFSHCVFFGIQSISFTSIFHQLALFLNKTRSTSQFLRSNKKTYHVFFSPSKQLQLLVSLRTLASTVATELKRGKKDDGSSNEKLSQLTKLMRLKQADGVGSMGFGFNFLQRFLRPKKSHGLWVSVLEKGGFSSKRCVFWWES